MLLLEQRFMTSSKTSILTQKHQLLPFLLFLMVSIKQSPQIVNIHFFVSCLRERERERERLVLD